MLSTSRAAITVANSAATLFASIVLLIIFLSAPFAVHGREEEVWSSAPHCVLLAYTLTLPKLRGWYIVKGTY